MIIEVTDVKKRLKGKDEVPALDVSLEIGCMNVLVFFEYKECNWERGTVIHVAGHIRPCENGESKKIKEFISSEEGKQKILNHNKVRLYTLF